MELDGNELLFAPRAAPPISGSDYPYTFPGLIADWNPIADKLALTGTAVDAFEDSTANAWTISQPTALRRLTYDSSLYQGKGGLIADRTQLQHMTGAAGLATAIDGAQPITVFSVFTRASEAFSGAMVGAGHATGASTDLLSQWFSTGGASTDWTFRRAGASTQNNGTINGGTLPNTKCWRWSGGVEDTWVGGAPSVVAKANVREPITDTFALAATLFGGSIFNQWDGSLGRQLIYTRRLDDAEVNSLNSWLASEYL